MAFPFGAVLRRITSFLHSHWLTRLWSSTRSTAPVSVPATPPAGVATTAPSRALTTPPTTTVGAEPFATLMALRTIRAYTDQPVGEEVMTALLDVARHSATSSFLQQTTIIRVLDPAVREQLRGAAWLDLVAEQGDGLVLRVQGTDTAGHSGEHSAP